jgi:putative Mg2+ transporter-C (MgtC) family protein
MQRGVRAGAATLRSSKCSRTRPHAVATLERSMLSTPELLLRLLLAMVLGGVIGYDRERKSSTAGLRTHMLVCLGAALGCIVSAFGFDDVLGHPDVVLDPSRIAAGVISGIGFLGAGAILVLRGEEVVRGLTTAAGLWTVAAIGLAAGAGLYVAALLGTAIAWSILAALKLVESRLFVRSRHRRIRLQVLPRAVILGELENDIAAQQVQLVQLSVRHHADADEIDLLFPRGVSDAQMMTLMQRLREFDGLKSLKLETIP